MLIPRILHYCWFGSHPMPNNLIDNICDWKNKCPNYKIIKWSEKNFPVYKNSFTAKAYKQNNWAFVSDYVRLYALYKFGGIYLDTDVRILKSFDSLLNKKAFIGLESWSSINSGLSFGAVPHNKNILAILRIYKKIGDSHNRLSKFNDNTVKIITDYFHSRGFKYRNRKQFVNGCNIYPTQYFCPQNRITGNINITKNTYSIHCYASSWTDSNYNKKRHYHILFGDLIKRVLRPEFYDFLYNVYLKINRGR